MRAIGLTKPSGAVKAKSSLSARGRILTAHSRDFQLTSLHWEYAEHKCWDPKDGELLLAFRCRNGKELTTDTRVQTQDGSHFLSLHVLGPQQREQRGHGRGTGKNKLGPTDRYVELWNFELF